VSHRSAILLVRFRARGHLRLSNQSQNLLMIENRAAEIMAKAGARRSLFEILLDFRQFAFRE
jgi:hypothetical protein